MRWDILPEDKTGNRIMASPAETLFEGTYSSANVRRLEESVVNRIAAGEVIERPASVIKELLENAIDAGATRIEVATSSGGKTMMRVVDNGSGMTRENLALAIERHCTSKLTDDLLDIRSLGFRGEALPSIGSVSRLSMTSRAVGEDDAWKIAVHGGKIKRPETCSADTGHRGRGDRSFLRDTGTAEVPEVGPGGNKCDYGCIQTDRTGLSPHPVFDIRR